MASVKVGDTVTVPGDMYGLVKFVGPVAGKQGTFAGVQLASDFVARGKNSGDVDGRFYFRTTVPGSGIFLPVEKAIKRAPAPASVAGSTAAGAGVGGLGRHTPATPTRLASFNQGGRASLAGPKPSFSQSLGPSSLRAGAASPSLRPTKPMAPRRESTARPTSPTRKTTAVSAVSTPAGAARAKMKQPPGVAVLGTPKPRLSLARSTIGTPSLYKTSTTKAAPLLPPSAAAGRRFTQSLRLTPSAAEANRVASPMLGPESSFDEEVPDDEAVDGDASSEHVATPTPNPLGSPAAARRRDSAVARENRKHEAEKQRLQKMLDEKDRALQEQGLSISEMEKNLIELQKLMPGLGDGGMSGSGRSSLPTESDAADEDLPRDVVSLRAVLREKNEKIRLLTAEFDANRADFRSTIDTLEMASNETERVYEKRVDELLEEVRHLQERVEDVDTVAQQLRQLEELVQELEEGLEDARRGEAEARAEVEFLRGEVERSRSELRRERDRIKAEEQLNGNAGGDGAAAGRANNSVDGERLDELQAELDSKDDEIRGLKAIIHSLNNSANDGADPKTAKVNGSPRKRASANDESAEATTTHALQKRVHDLENLLQLRSAKEEELEHEVNQLRNSAQLAKFPMPGPGPAGSSLRLRAGTGSSRGRPDSDDLRRNALKHFSSGTQSTVVLSPNTERKDLHPGSPVKARTATVPGIADALSEADRSEATSSSSTVPPWCELCEEAGHDILACNNMASSSAPPSKPQPEQKHLPLSHSPHPSIDRPAPLIGRKSNASISSNPTQPPTEALPVPPTAQKPAALPLDSASVDDPNERLEEEKLDGHAFGIASLHRDDSNDHEREEQHQQQEPQKQAKGPIEGTGDQAGMWAGKTSGVIDPDKWCALCERDGHDSVDCPIEDAF